MAASKRNTSAIAGIFISTYPMKRLENTTIYKEFSNTFATTGNTPIALVSADSIIALYSKYDEKPQKQVK